MAKIRVAPQDGHGKVCLNLSLIIHSHSCWNLLRSPPLCTHDTMTGWIMALGKKSWSSWHDYGSLTQRYLALLSFTSIHSGEFWSINHDILHPTDINYATVLLITYTDPFTQSHDWHSFKSLLSSSPVISLHEAFLLYPLLRPCPVPLHTLIEF